MRARVSHHMLPSLAETIVREVGRPDVLVTDPDILESASVDYRGWFRGAALAMARPKSAAEVQRIVRACARHQVAIVPQGGNSSLCGGAVPAAGHGPSVILNTTGLDRIRSVDAVGWSMVAEAGCTLATVQDAARDAGRRFALDIGARGSARVGGLIATNAGGSAVVRYGSCRELVLGLEVVLPDGEIWSGLRTLRKDNSGFDLKHLFIGSEGTLGIITAAALRLHPADQESVSTLLALPSLSGANELADFILDRAQGQVSAIELMPAFGIDLACRHVTRSAPPLPLEAEWYMLVRFESRDAAENLAEEISGAALEAGLSHDAVVSRSKSQEDKLWSIRDGFSDVHRHLGVSHRFDLSVPLGRVPDLYRDLCRAITSVVPGFRPFAFGHMGDGNLHFSACQPPDEDGTGFADAREAITQVANDVVWRLGGSISAEHGIGQLHRSEMAGQKSLVELDLMSRIKSVLDPLGSLNPGKLLPDTGQPVRLISP